jgi:hypothetical protein
MGRRRKLAFWVGDDGALHVTAGAEYVIEHMFTRVEPEPHRSGVMKASVVVEGELDAATQTFTGTVHIPVR